MKRGFVLALMLALMSAGCFQPEVNQRTFSHAGGRLETNRFQLQVDPFETQNLTVTMQSLQQFRYRYRLPITAGNTRFLALTIPTARFRDAHVLHFSGERVRTQVRLTFASPVPAPDPEDFTFGYALLEGKVENFSVSRGGQVMHAPLDRLLVNRAIESQQPITVFVVEVQKSAYKQACAAAGGTFFVMKCQLKP